METPRKQSLAIPSDTQRKLFPLQGPAKIRAALSDVRINEDTPSSCARTVRREERTPHRVPSRVERREERREAQRIAGEKLISDHLRREKTPGSFGEHSMKNLIDACNNARRLKGFLPKDFRAIVRCSSRSALKKQIKSLIASKKKRLRTKEADFDVVEKILEKITIDAILEAEENELLIECLKKNALEDDKELDDKENELQECSRQFLSMKRRKAGQDWSDESDDE